MSKSEFWVALPSQPGFLTETFEIITVAIVEIYCYKLGALTQGLFFSEYSSTYQFENWCNTWTFFSPDVSPLAQKPIIARFVIFKRFPRENKRKRAVSSQKESGTLTCIRYSPVSNSSQQEGRDLALMTSCASLYARVSTWYLVLTLSTTDKTARPANLCRSYRLRPRRD